MAKKKAEPKVVIHNFVAKHMHEVNQSQVFVDRKKMQNEAMTSTRKGDIQMIISFFNVRSLGLKTFKPSQYVLRI